MGTDLPKGVKFYFTNKIIPADSLCMQERFLCETYENQRRIDFSRGRHCAHRCLSLFGVDSPLLMDDEGVPIWPEGFVGSISHVHDWAGAILGSKNEFQSLGFDIEKIGRVKEEIWPVLFTKKEQEFLKSYPSSLRKQYSTIFFSLKESYYKMQFPITRQGVESEEIEIHIEKDIKIKCKNNFILSGQIQHFFEVKHNHVFSYSILYQE